MKVQNLPGSDLALKPVIRALSILKTSWNGLSGEEAARRLNLISSGAMSSANSLITLLASSVLSI